MGCLINKKSSRKPTVNIAALAPMQSMAPTKRMAVLLEVDGIKRTALIDSGCSALIIAKKVVQERKMKTKARSSVAFRFADGRVANSNVVVEVTVRKGTYEAVMKFYALDITSDMIRGIPFLQSIIVTHQDVSAGRLEFQEKAAKTRHAWMIDGMVDDVTISEVHGGSDAALSARLFKRFSDIFKEPSQVPPSRPEDIAITL